MTSVRNSSSNGSHVVRGSFAAATGESRRRGSAAPTASALLEPGQQSGSGSGSGSGVPTSLDALLRRAETLPQEDSSAAAPIFTDRSLDANDSQFAFTNGARFSSQQSAEDSAEQLHEEISVLQHALINRFRGSQKAVSGCQFRISAPQKFSKCEQCDARDKALSKAKDLIRRLKNSQNQERSQTSAAVRRPPEDEEALRRACGERDELSRRNAALSAELLRLKDLLAQQPEAPKPAASAPVEVNRDTDPRLQALLDQNAMLSEVIRDISDQKDALEARCSTLESNLDEKGRLHAELQEKYSRHEQEHANEANALKLQLKTEKQAHADSVSAQRERYEAQLAELRAAAEGLSAELQSRAEQLAASREAAEAARAGLIEEKKAGLALSAENQSLNKKIKDLQEEIADLQKHRRVAENELQLSKEQVEDLRRQVQTLAAERERVLQTAVSGSVRLCIVAPTVNVHVADKKLNFRSKVPTEELNGFLQKEILSRYTFLFRQEYEDTSPEAGTPLQAFMHKALGDMQSVIENHIHAAMGSKDQHAVG